MSLLDWTTNYEGQQNTPEHMLEEAISSGTLPLTHIGVFGMRDPLRARVHSCVTYAREHAKLNVRLVSGDHIETAKAVAIKTGILLPEEAGAANAIMTGEEFRNEVQISSTTNAEGEIEYTVNEPDNFKEIVQNLRVLARATASDKHILVAGLKSVHKRVVAVTGDGINDVDALNLSDVGISMGTGAAAAKEVSSIVLTADDFEASLRAVMWGRNIFHNISRFIQFQVTVNISVLVTVFVGIIAFNQSPMNAVQLLWINLIMDTFAALSLSTEPPLKQVIKGKPYKSDVSILTLTVRG